MGSKGTGVELRDSSLRIYFRHDGKQQRVTLKIEGKPLLPTPANIKVAQRLAQNIAAATAKGTFTWGEFFPESNQALAEAKTDSANTFAEWCALWLDTKGRCAAKTRNQYRNALEVWKRLLGADTPLRAIGHAKVAAVVGKEDWASAKLLNNYLICLRGVFRLASRDMRIDNAMTGVDNSKAQAVEPDPLTAAEAHRIVEHIRKHYDVRQWAYFVFAFATGMRPQEQIALRWSDIDWNLKTALVQRAKIAGDTKPVKTYETRYVDLSAQALAALEAMKPFTESKGMAADVFQNPNTGRPWHDDRSQRDHCWTPTLSKLGIRHRRAYQTRHTFATIALMGGEAGGVNPTYVSRQMGHANAKMLFEVYSKWIDGADYGRERARMQAAQDGAAQDQAARIAQHAEAPAS